MRRTPDKAHACSLAGMQCLPMPAGLVHSQAGPASSGVVSTPAVSIGIAGQGRRQGAVVGWLSKTQMLHQRWGRRPPAWLHMPVGSRSLLSCWHETDRRNTVKQRLACDEELAGTGRRLTVAGALGAAAVLLLKASVPGLLTETLLLAYCAVLS